MEYKNCNITELKFAETETGVMSFKGYGAVFGNVDAYGDVIEHGAFSETLSQSQKTNSWPSMLLQHGGWGMTAEDLTPIGVWVDISEDKKGLKVEGHLADTPRGQEIYTLLKMEPRPAINGLSIGYRVKEFTERTAPDKPRRTLTKLDLIEISPVTFPANGKARIRSVKNIDDLERPADIEAFLREAGMSRDEAKHLIAKIKGVDLREAETSEQIAIAEILKLNSQILGGQNNA